jgi:hypothetical protein
MGDNLHAIRFYMRVLIHQVVLTGNEQNGAVR